MPGFCNFIAMITTFWSTKIRFSNSIKVFKEFLYSNFVLKQKIIRRYILKTLGYCKSRTTYILGFNSISKLVKKFLKVLANLD